MIDYELEPLEINLNAPNGTYEITVNIKAYSDTVFSIYAQQRILITSDYEIKSGEEFEHKFTVNVSDDEYENLKGIKIRIDCDGDLSATAMAQNIDVPCTD